MRSKIRAIAFSHYENNASAGAWKQKIMGWLQKKYPAIALDSKKPDAVLVLGGDGAILEAARKYQKYDSIILGLNLGNVGFLASVRQEEKFLTALDKLFKGRFRIAERMMLQAKVFRNKKQIFAAYALNDIAIQNPLGIVEMEVRIEEHPFQYIHGTGILIATPTGSTAYNLSAHGPLVMPEIKCMIVTELFDHNIPSPSLVVGNNQKITVSVLNFRKREILTIKNTKEPVDTLLIADGETIFPLQKNDRIVVRESPRLIKFAEFEKNYFLKSIQEKFAFK